MQVTWSLVAGGSEIYATTLAARIDLVRFRTAVCAIDQGGALEPELARLRIPVQVMHRRPGIAWGLMWRMYQVFRRQRIDVVHTHHFNQLFYCALGARLAGARLVHTEHDVSQLGRWRIRFALRLLSFGCDAVVAVGHDVADALRRQVGINPSKLRIIGGGVDAAVPRPARSQARRELGLDDDEAVVAIVARLSPEKNHRLLLNAFAQVCRQVPRARLLIVGDGPCAAEVRAQADALGLAPRVWMPGVRRDVGRVLSACDLFVLASDREGLPLAMLEAMVAGRAVVATNVGDVPRAVQDGQTGLIVPPGDVAALSAAMVALLADPARCARMGHNARQRAEAEFGVHRMIEAHEQLYEPR